MLSSVVLPVMALASVASAQALTYAVCAVQPQPVKCVVSEVTSVVGIIVNQYCPSNTVIRLECGLTFVINNAPTQFYTSTSATITTTNTVTSTLTNTVTATTTATTTVGPSLLPAADFAGFPFLLQVGLGAGPAIAKRQAVAIAGRYVLSDGTLTSAPNVNSPYLLAGGILAAANGMAYATLPNSISDIFAASAAAVTEQAFALFGFRSLKQTLIWQDASFVSGRANFCYSYSSNKVRALFKVGAEANCEPIFLNIVNTANITSSSTASSSTGTSTGTSTGISTGTSTGASTGTSTGTSTNPSATGTSTGTSTTGTSTTGTSTTGTSTTSTSIPSNFVLQIGSGSTKRQAGSYIDANGALTSDINQAQNFEILAQQLFTQTGQISFDDNIDFKAFVASTTPGPYQRTFTAPNGKLQFANGIFSSSNGIARFCTVNNVLYLVKNNGPTGCQFVSLGVVAVADPGSSSTTSGTTSATSTTTGPATGTTTGPATGTTTSTATTATATTTSSTSSASSSASASVTARGVPVNRQEKLEKAARWLAKGGAAVGKAH